MKKLVILLFIFLAGCSQSIVWDQQNYTDHKALAIQKVATWSFNSGFFTCAIGASSITFPTTLKNAADFQALVSNPTTTMGITQLDEIVRRLGKWSQEDFDLGCFQGTQTRMTAAQIIAAIKVLYPQAAPYLPSFGQ